jgi:hypothetical protein
VAPPCPQPNSESSILPDHDEYGSQASQQQNDVNRATVNAGFAVSSSLGRLAAVGRGMTADTRESLPETRLPG